MGAQNSTQPAPPNFIENPKEWLSYQENLFQKQGKKPSVQGVVQTLDDPEWIKVLNSRQKAYSASAKGDEDLAWESFKEEVVLFAELSQQVRSTAVAKEDALDGSIGAMLKYLESADPNDVKGILARYPQLQDMMAAETGQQIGFHIPTFDQIKRFLLEKLNQVRQTLETVLQDGKATADESLKALAEFVNAHESLLPQELKNVMSGFNQFCKDHPLIVAAASAALVIVASEVIIAPAVFEVLELLGFSQIGPVAGSWAAAIQSVVYGGRTGGLFSIFQSITMTAKRVWPLHAFIDLSALAGVAVFEKERIRDLAEQLRREMQPPPLQSMVNESEELTAWMEGIKQKCQEAQVPEVQWGDVALQMVYGIMKDAAQ